MNDIFVRIRGLDTLLFRDGRPFSNEPGAFSARTLRTPLPGTLGGFLRTRIGNREKDWDWEKDGPSKALEVAVAGPILMLDDEPVFHAPADALVYEEEKVSDPQKEKKVMCLRPCADNGGTNIPDGLRPMQVTEDVKALPGYNYWKWEEIKRWLLYSSGNDFPFPTPIDGLPLEERVHVEISDNGTSEEGKLFTAQFLAFDKHEWQDFRKTKTEEWSILAKVKTDITDLKGTGQFGGENRPAVIVTVSEGDWPPCPDNLKKALSGATHVRMILATPAIFKHGWKPDWLGTNLTGTPPGLTGCTLSLVAAAVKRREPVSGWDYQNKQPKAVRWMVPAGSIFFFKVLGNSGIPVEQVWLKPVSDDPQDQRDGYGLALWGIWNDNIGGNKT